MTLAQHDVETYRRKRSTAAEAVGSVRSGDRVWVHAGCNSPDELVAALVARAPELRGVEICHLMTLGRADYVNDPFVIAQNERMVAINSALAVDLTGQVCADSIGCHMYSGFGGQLDFIRGASRSKGGKPIIALPSSARNGKVSRICDVLAPGSGVVTTRGDVHDVVTELGVARLYGKSLRERAEALISIAHPDFRQELRAAARNRHLL